MKLYDRIRTPCIGVCSTGIGDSVCRGCKRFDQEVILWNGYSEVEKAAIDNRLASLLSQVVQRYFTIFDVDLLQRQLQIQQLSYAAHRDPYCWLFELLKAGAGQIADTGEYGFARIADYKTADLVNLRQDIDTEYYALSVAHYERYMVANRKRANCVSV